MVRRTLAIAAVAIALGAAGACSRSDDRDTASVARDESARIADGTDQFSGEALSATSAGGGAARAGQSTVEGASADTVGASQGEHRGAPLPQGLGQSKIVKTASIDVEVPDGGFNAAFAKVPGIAAANGGFVASSTSTQARDGGGDDGNRQAAGSLVVRVPAENFEATRSQLIALGELKSQQLKGEDVGGRLTDLEARLRNLRSQEEAIRLLMSKANTVGETIEVQRQLFAVREQIEQLSSEQARLADAVALSTITLSLAEPGAATRGPGNRSPLADAWQRAVDGAQSVLAGLIVGLGYLVPLALLLGAGWLVLRPFLRRRETEPAPTNP